jgi:hypothetical protein
MMHPYGGAYKFGPRDNLGGDPVLVLSYIKPVVTFFAEKDGVPWQPTE